MSKPKRPKPPKAASPLAALLTSIKQAEKGPFHTYEEIILKIKQLWKVVDS